MKEYFLNNESNSFINILIKYLLVSFVGVLVGVLVFASYLYDRDFQNVKSDELQDIKVTEYAMESFLDDVASDLKTMSSMQIFHTFLFGAKESKELQLVIEDICVNLIKSKPLYNQIRFIDVDGMEIFRIDNNLGDIKVYSEDELQYKGDRYYFEEAIKLGKGDLYLSPFDLNVENNKVEVPYRPVIRLAIPVFDNQNIKKGIFIANYSGEELLRSLKGQDLLNVSDSYILNSDNFFLLAPVDSLEWGFMFPDRQKSKLGAIFPNDEAVINTIQNGQFLSKTGLFTFSQVKPFSHDYDKKLFKVFPQNYMWKVMFFIPHSKVGWMALLPWKGFIVAFIFILLITWAIVYSYARVTYKKSIVQQALILSEKNLKKSNETKDQFFSILSHDLRNSASTILSFLDYINTDFNKLDKSELQHYIHNVQMASYQHHNLLDKILNWARLQLNRKLIEPIEIELNDLFHNQYNTNKLALEKKHIKFEMSIDENLRIIADLEMISTVFRNLINNAIKFTPIGGKIKIEATDLVGQIEIRVIDSGIGIAKNDIDKLFNLLSSFHKPGTENESGSGFGLKMVAEMISKNKGTIKVESELDKGSQFIVTFPSVIRSES